jgi:hypothetical protein
MEIANAIRKIRKLRLAAPLPGRLARILIDEQATGGGSENGIERRLDSSTLPSEPG